jgi:hypothetical protein
LAALTKIAISKEEWKVPVMKVVILYEKLP